MAEGEGVKIGIDNYSYHRYFNEIYPGQAKPAELWDLKTKVCEINDLLRNMQSANRLIPPAALFLWHMTKSA